jgi:hypothetical protein
MSVGGIPSNFDPSMNLPPPIDPVMQMRFLCNAFLNEFRQTNPHPAALQATAESLVKFLDNPNNLNAVAKDLQAHHLGTDAKDFLQNDLLPDLTALIQNPSNSLFWSNCTIDIENFVSYL